MLNQTQRCRRRAANPIAPSPTKTIPAGSGTAPRDCRISVGEYAPVLLSVEYGLPGGIGPLTITMLMHNTLRAARARVGDHDNR